MPSQVTPNNINQNFPIAGVDNNSQGFRDNFTGTKNNFTILKREIEDLQDKVVVKAPLTYGSTPTVTSNNFNNNQISSVVLKDVSLASEDYGVSTITENIVVNVSSGNFKTISLNGSGASSQLVFENWPAAGQFSEVTVRVVVANVLHTLGIYSNAGNPNFIFTEKICGFNHATNVITFSHTGEYEFVFGTVDAGLTISVIEKSPRTLMNVLTSNVVINATSTSNSLTSTGLSFYTKANIPYQFEATLPFVHSLSSGSVHSFGVQFGNVSATSIYTVEQQDAPGNAFVTLTSNSSNVYSNVTTTSSTLRMAKISGIYSHTTNDIVTITGSTDGGNLTVIGGACIKATPLV
jgi:hypothetical protein